MTVDLLEATAADLYCCARLAVAAGMSVVPIAGDGTKRPALPWRAYQDRAPTVDELGTWFGDGRAAGIGVVCGAVSGGLEMLELEGRADETLRREIADLADATGLRGVLDRVQAGWSERSPSGGLHLLYRCAEIAGNTKLARNAQGEVLIETRGEGGQVVMAPTSGAAHPSGRPWETISGGPETVATITPAERRELHRMLATFDQQSQREWTSSTPAVPARSEWDDERPGDVYNRTTAWADILEPLGWQQVGQRGDVGYWRRPGKITGVSATTNALGTDRLKVFSSSTSFSTDGTYDKLGALAVLEHGGDISAAARALRDDGYGAERAARADTDGWGGADPVTGEVPAEHATAIATGWEPVDLRAIMAGDLASPPMAAIARTDGPAMFYRGKVHSIAGLPESAKGWLALRACADEIDHGGHVVYLDFEDGPETAVERLRALGVPDPAILERFHYYRIDSAYTPAAGQQLHAELERTGAVLVVIDAVSEAMAVCGLNPYDNPDTVRWWAMLPAPIARRGATVVLIDHLTKDAEARGRFAIGAQHKLAAIDGAAFSVDVIQSFGRGRTGQSKITVMKDRPGRIRQHATDGKTFATLRLVSWPDDRVDVCLMPASDQAGGDFRPTGFMERLSRYIEDHEGMSKRSVLSAVKGDDKIKRLAIDLLQSEGYITITKDGTSHLLASVKQFRNDEELA